MILRSILVFGVVFSSVIGISQEKNNSWKSFPTATDTITVGTEGVLTDHKIQVEENAHNTVLITPGSTTVNASDEIKKMDIDFTEKSKNHPQIKGYTILLFSGSGANSKLYARNTLVKFEETFPSCETHLAWKSPNYEVRAGNFRTKLEAEQLLQIIKKDFPTAFVKTALIDLPSLDKPGLPTTEKN